MNVRIISSFIKSMFSYILRRTYQLYRLFSIQGAQNIHLKTSVSVEGKGKIRFGQGVSIAEDVYFGLPKQSSLTVEDEVIFQQGISFRFSNEAHLNIGACCSFARFSRIYPNSNWSIGEHSMIGADCQIFGREKGLKGMLRIGKSCSIGDATVIDVSNDVIIENQVALGPNCIVYTHDHDYQTNLKGAAWKGDVVSKPVRIGENSWIGANVIILPGVTIGKRAIIAAGAVVTKDIEAGGVYAGVPAKRMDHSTSKSE